MDRYFSVLIEHGMGEGDFEARVASGGAVAFGRVDPARQVGSIVLGAGQTLGPVIDRLAIAFPGVRWYSFASADADPMALRAA